MKRKVLILGGGGFIGSAIAKILSSRGNYEITVADIFIRSQDDDEFLAFIKSTGIKLIKGDFTNPSMFKSLDKDYDDF